MLASKNYYKEKSLPPQPDGAQKEETKKLNTITCQPIHQCSRNTKQYSKRCVFQHLTGTHQPTNHHRLAGQQTNQHTTMHTKIKNKYIGTLLSSQTSSPHNSYMPKSMELVASKKLFLSGPVFLSPLQPETMSCLCGALSVALTRIKLHTALKFHKLAVQNGF